MSMAIQRSKYTGDPGLFDFFKGLGKTALGVASGLPIVGGAARVASGYLFPPTPGTTTYSQMPNMGTIPQSPQGMPGSGTPPGAFRIPKGGLPAGCGPGMAVSGNFCIPKAPALGINPPFAGARGIGIDTPFGRYSLGEQMNGAGAMDLGAMQAGKPCPVSGYHWNKSGYFLQSGEYVPPGTKMVKNRRRNPANPRATSNAITRIKGAKRYAASLSSISIRKKC